MATLALTRNKLDIRNPLRLWGFACVGTGAGIAALLWLTVSEWLPYVPSILQDLQRNPDALRQDVPHAVRLGLLLVTAWYGAISALVAVGLILRGLKCMLTFFVPTHCPGPIDNAGDALSELLFHRNILCYRTPPASLRLLAHVSERYRYLTPAQRCVVEQLVHSVKGWVIVLALFCLPPLIDAYQPGILGFHPWWSFPTVLATAAAVIIAARALVVLASVPESPQATVFEARDHLDNCGNPLDFFLHAKERLDDFRHQDFPNRGLGESRPNISNVQQGVTSSFQCAVGVETQPVPIHRIAPLAALVADLCGGTLRVAGLYFLLTLYRIPAMSESSLRADLTLAAFQLIAGRAAWRAGGVMLNLARGLHHVFRFHSDVYHLVAEGSYTSGGIGLGDGRGGQFHASRSQLQSNVHLTIRATRIICECTDLAGPRTIVSTRPDSEFEFRLNSLLAAVMSHQDEGGKLPTVNMNDPNLINMAQANAQIAAMGAKATALALEQKSSLREMGLLPAEVASSSPRPADPGKVCPDCAEESKSAARKCWKCGHVFNPVAA